MGIFDQKIYGKDQLSIELLKDKPYLIINYKYIM